MVKRIKKIKKTIGYLRPPVVTIMGHVDHGKTSLLDYIRKTSVASREAGGITQHIGAYQVDFDHKKITFIDTPGHEAFAKMRARGALVTDIVILVVAANDGVMPQTIESIQHIKAAKVPVIVAINKIDLPEANIEKVKRQLSKADILVEGYGGDIVSVPLSAKTGKGVNDLLEMIILYAEMNQEKFTASPNGHLKAYVIESNIDKSCGPIATILIKNGTLKLHEKINISGISGKIRALINDNGKNISEASPSVPVKVLGLEKVPPVGALVIRGGEEAEKPEEIKKELTKEDEGKERIKVILKADTVGSIEALIYSLPPEVEIFEKGIGEINESDVLLAKTVKAVILGFNVNISPNVEKLAETERVLVKSFKIIYELLDEIGEVIEELNKPKPTEKILGKAKIIADFSGSSGRIAGCKILEGKINLNDNLRLEHDNKIVTDNLKIKTMKHLKEDVSKASMGMECGIILTSEVDFRVGDMLISYRKLE